MELFTLGEGHYGEQDVKEAARAFTGWSLERETGSFLWRAPMHDTGEKRVLGRSGNFDGDDVLDILLAQPATAEFIAGAVAGIRVAGRGVACRRRGTQARGRALHASGLDIRQTLRALLLTRAFWASENRGALVKSPVDLVVGSLRTLDVSVPDALPLAFTVRNLGQGPLCTANVRGWPGGDAWINSTTLLARKQFVERLLRNDDFVVRPVRADGVEAGFEQGAMQNRQRVQQLREEFGKGRGASRAKRAHAHGAGPVDIRFDSRSWFARFPIPAPSNARCCQSLPSHRHRPARGASRWCALMRSIPPSS